MQTFLNLLKQRRVWTVIVGLTAFGLSALKVQYSIDVPVMTDALTSFGGALADLIMAGLALWSYMAPKK